jgi:hypothetical protein
MAPGIKGYYPTRPPGNQGSATLSSAAADA